jgi:hypothetical protein
MTTLRTVTRPLFDKRGESALRPIFCDPLALKRSLGPLRSFSQALRQNKAQTMPRVRTAVCTGLCAAQSESYSYT